MGFRDGEKITMFLPFYIVLSTSTKVLATTGLEPYEIVGMVDYAHGIGLGVADA
jgi:hypothetical protein